MTGPFRTPSGNAVSDQRFYTAWAISGRFAEQGHELANVSKVDMHPLMNDTKWDELRRAMYELGDLAPRWRTRDVENGYLSEWDREWFHHFHEGGYRFIQWVEIAVDTFEQSAAVLAELVRIHVPGERTERGYRVIGYVKTDQVVDYIAG